MNNGDIAARLWVLENQVSEVLRAIHQLKLDLTEESIIDAATCDLDNT